jgi:tRNA-specific 2-thiouridylase
VLTPQPENQQRIAVAMSGGVDSSVAALLLKEAGNELIGISMQVWDYRQNGGCKSRATCCAPDDFADARQVAARINVPYYVFDFEETFRREVINPFVESYAQGLTPNPCVECNNKVKFRELRERVIKLQFKAVATGHYARIEERSEGLVLLRGIDRDKDQSYFLYGIQSSELAFTRFPIGHLKKSEVRELARAAGFNTADKAESQDICFVSGPVKDFLVRLGTKKRHGLIKDINGNVLGEHDGIHQYTVGQRRGLGVGGSHEPTYVLELDAATNSVIVGAKSQLEREDFEVQLCNWIHPSAKPSNQPIVMSAIAQLRHRHEGTAVQLTIGIDGNAKAVFTDTWATVSPGQSAVFYDLNNEVVLGGGIIRGRAISHPRIGQVSTAIPAL